MTETMSQSLSSLRDVDGVLGSFVWDRAGSLLARDLPAYFSSSVLSETAPRLERICDAFRDAGDPLGEATLVYAQHKLHVRELDAALLVVVSALSVNAPALKMALRLVSRSVAASLPGTRASTPAPTAPEPAASASAPPAAPERPSAPARARYYRGQRID